MSQLFVLFEHAIGYSLFKIVEFEEIGTFIPQVEASICDFSKFVKIVQLFGFKPFKNAVSALENINAVSEGVMTNELSGFLEANIPASSSKVTLGVCDPKLGASISEVHKFKITHVGVVPEVLRGIRSHLVHYIKGLKSTSLKQTELGLGHSYSRGKVKFNVNKADNMIIQSIALIDQLDKDINTFTMRIREWYSYHFPELAKIVTDNYQYALCAHYIKLRTSLDESKFEELEKIIQDSDKAQGVIDAGKMSMGMDIAPIDLLNIEIFAKRIASLAKYRKTLGEYLKKKMSVVAPNLSVLIGDMVGARLISHAGSLINLAKCPASTVQILGAEKALFRAIKTRSNTPKYGLIYHSTFIGRAGMANKGRISRFLANKCSLATRIDSFADHVSTVFGETFRSQVEERLKFYETGELPQKNVDVMICAVEQNLIRVKEMRKLEKKKRKKEAQQMEAAAQELSEEPPKKKKKAAKVTENVEEQVEVPSPEVTEAVNSTKKKKKKNKEMDQSMNDTVNGNAVEEDCIEEEQVDLEASFKKKKKSKKSKEVTEDGHIDNCFPQDTPTPDKKKKRKSKGENMEC